MARLRLVLPLVVVFALVSATPALALPHLNKTQSRKVSDIVERWVNDVIRGRDLADGWKIAGAAERGGITRKQWISGKALPVMQMKVRNDPRTSWYATGTSGNELFLTVSLMTGRGNNKEMIDHSMTLEKRHGHWDVYAFYADGIFRLGKGHSGSCVSSSCKVTGINDYKAGGPVGGNGGAITGRIAGNWGILVVVGILGLPFFVLLGLVLVALTKSRKARRARLAYAASRTS